MKKYYLGVSALHHNSAATLIDSEGNILASSLEEKRIKEKNTSKWPENSIQFCKRFSPDNATELCFYEKPNHILFRRLISNPRSYKKFFDEHKIIKNLKSTSNHMSHLWATRATSGFDEGIFIVANSIGEYDSLSAGYFTSENFFKKIGISRYNSLGILYSSILKWLGFKPNKDEEYFSLLSIGHQPTKIDQVKCVMDIDQDGFFKFKYDIRNGIEHILGTRPPVSEFGEWSASLNYVISELLNNILKSLYHDYRDPDGVVNIILAGSLFNNRFITTALKETQDVYIKGFWVMPNPDEHCASLGAALSKANVQYVEFDMPFYGASVDGDSQPVNELLVHVCNRLQNGEVIGWIQGKEEFSNHTLGHRSILADPRNKEAIQKIKNIQDKHFDLMQHSILEEEAFSYFKTVGNYKEYRNGRFLSTIRNEQLFNCIENKQVILQTVPRTSDSFSRLMRQWKNTSNFSVLINEDFNKNNKPLISERKDAINMLLDSEMDALVIGNRLYFKTIKPSLTDESDGVIADVIDFSKGKDNLII